MKECHVSIDSVFRRDHVRLVEEYIERVNRLLSCNDTAVFVARKALCFYRALKANGRINNHTCAVVSSRALGYPGFKPRGRVVVFDDVAVTGSALNKVCSSLDARHIAYSIMVGAMSESIDSLDNISIRSMVIRTLKPADIYSLAREITLFIQLSCVSNNVDQPMFRAQMEEGVSPLDALEGHEWVDVSCGQKLDTDILNATLTYDSSRVFDGLFSDLFCEGDAICKVRCYSMDGLSGITLVPFVLLPELTDEAISRMFNAVTYAGIDSYVGIDRLASTTANRLRVVQYALSKYLGEAVANSIDGISEVEVDTVQEKELFGEVVSGFLRPSLISYDNVEFSELPTSGLDRNQLLGYVGCLRDDVQARLMDKDVFLTPFDILHGSGLVDDGYDARVITSSCIDVLVDLGVLVPMVYQTESEGSVKAVRAYRGGEVFRLTEHIIDCFAVCLLFYLEQTGKSGISVDIVYRAAVIFYRWFIRQSNSSSIESTSPLVYSFEASDLSLKEETNRLQHRRPHAMIDSFVQRGAFIFRGGMLYRLARSEIVATKYELDGYEQSRIYQFGLGFAELIASCADDHEHILETLELVIVARHWEFALSYLRYPLSYIDKEIRNDSSWSNTMLSEMLDIAERRLGIVARREDVEKLPTAVSELSSPVYGSIVWSFIEIGLPSDTDVKACVALFAEVGAIVEELMSLRSEGQLPNLGLRINLERVVKSLTVALSSEMAQDSKADAASLDAVSSVTYRTADIATIVHARRRSKRKRVSRCFPLKNSGPLPIDKEFAERTTALKDCGFIESDKHGVLVWFPYKESSLSIVVKDAKALDRLVLDQPGTVPESLKRGLLALFDRVKSQELRMIVVCRPSDSNAEKCYSSLQQVLKVYGKEAAQVESSSVETYTNSVTRYDKLDGYSFDYYYIVSLQEERKEGGNIMTKIDIQGDFSGVLGDGASIAFNGSNAVGNNASVTVTPQKDWKQGLQEIISDIEDQNKRDEAQKCFNKLVVYEQMEDSAVFNDEKNDAVDRISNIIQGAEAAASLVGRFVALLPLIRIALHL